MRLRVAACQILTVPSPEASAAKVVRWIERAAGEGVEVVAFPEASLCGYAAAPEYWASADPAAFAAAEAGVVRAAARHRIAVVLGTPAWEAGAARGDRPYNSLLLIDRDGTVRGRYAKTHLAERWPAPGRRLPLVTLAGVPSCFIICHDVRYPELVRLPAIAGAQICYFCSNESGLLQEYKLSAYRAMPIARATENSIFLVMANAPASPDDLHSPSQSHGNSKIVHPDGNVLDEAGFFEERLVTATIDLDAADRAMARRAVGDESVLRAWLAEGARLVEVDAGAAGAVADAAAGSAAPAPAGGR
jgi:predicted amidohydrolase